MRVRYTLPALADLDDLLTYIEARSPAGALRIIRQIRATEDLIAQFPYCGRLTNRSSIRRIKTSKFPYLIFYEVVEKEVIVHAVRHGARRPSTMQDAG